MKTRKILTSSLTSLALTIATGVAIAEQPVTSPTLDGGITGSLGAMYVVPSVTNDDYGYSLMPEEGNTTILNVNPDFEFGLLATLGYVFPNTANMVELSYRGLFESDSTSSRTADGYDTNFIVPKLPTTVFDGEFETTKSKLEIEHHGADLMFSQFMNLGKQVQMRFSAGVSYVDYEQKQSSHFGILAEPFEDCAYNETSKTDFSGFGPRVGIDGRYGFGEGFGIVAAGSAAYYVGDLDTRFTATETIEGVSETTYRAKNNKSDHGVTNLRGSVGFDYVYYFDNDERSTVAFEIGYMADWYDDMSGEIEVISEGAINYDTHSVTFTGPYVLMKGAF